MSEDILDQYGPDSRQGQAPRATNGGRQSPKPIPYDRPKGPTNQMHQGPGLADSTNHGCCGTQGRY